MAETTSSPRYTQRRRCAMPRARDRRASGQRVGPPRSVGDIGEVAAARELERRALAQAADRRARAVRAAPPRRARRSPRAGGQTSATSAVTTPAAGGVSASSRASVVDAPRLAPVQRSTRGRRARVEVAHPQPSPHAQCQSRIAKESSASRGTPAHRSGNPPATACCRTRARSPVPDTRRSPTGTCSRDPPAVDPRGLRGSRGGLRWRRAVSPTYIQASTAAAAHELLVARPAAAAAPWQVHQGDGRRRRRCCRWWQIASVGERDFADCVRSNSLFPSRRASWRHRLRAPVKRWFLASVVVSRSCDRRSTSRAGCRPIVSRNVVPRSKYPCAGRSRSGMKALLPPAAPGGIARHPQVGDHRRATRPSHGSRMPAAAPCGDQVQAVGEDRHGGRCGWRRDSRSSSCRTWSPKREPRRQRHLGDRQSSARRCAPTSVRRRRSEIMSAT